MCTVKLEEIIFTPRTRKRASECTRGLLQRHKARGIDIELIFDRAKLAPK